MRRPITVFGLLVMCSCGGVFGTPEDISVLGQYDGKVVIHWAESSALGLYVVHPDAWVPTGPRQSVRGESHWVVEATSFPGGFSAPVTYSVLPEGAKDTTAAHGGPRAAAALQCDTEYKVSVVSIGGTATAMASWDCP